MLLQFAGVIGIGCSAGAIVRTIFSAGTRFICRTHLIAMCRIRRGGLVFPACLSCRRRASFEISGFSRSRDGWFALVFWKHAVADYFLPPEHGASAQAADRRGVA